MAAVVFQDPDQGAEVQARLDLEAREDGGAHRMAGKIHSP